MKKIGFGLLLAAGFFSGCYYDIESELYPNFGSANCDSATFSYVQRIEPIIKNNCYECHSASANLGNVNLEGYDQLKFYADNGKLWGSISHKGGFSAMPKNRGKLQICELYAIDEWIKRGLPQ